MRKWQWETESFLGNASQLLAGSPCQGLSQENMHIPGKSENRRGQENQWTKLRSGQAGNHIPEFNKQKPAFAVTRMGVSAFTRQSFNFLRKWDLRQMCQMGRSRIRTWGRNSGKYTSTPRSTWFTEIKYFEMNVQEIAFFTAFCCFPHMYMWDNGLLPQAGKLSRNLISESTLEIQSFTDTDRKQKDRRQKAEKPYIIFLSAFALPLACSLCVFLFKKSWFFLTPEPKHKRKIPTAFHHWQQYLHVRENENMKWERNVGCSLKKWKLAIAVVIDSSQSFWAHVRGYVFHSRLRHQKEKAVS